MNIKTLIQRMLNGEQLSDQEKDHLKAFDPDAVAAAARKSASERATAAETELASLREQLAKLQSEVSEAGKGEAEKSRSAISKLEAQIAAVQKERDAEKAEKAKLIRDSKVSALIAKVKIIPGVSEKVVRRAIEDSLAEVPTEELEASATSVLDAFSKDNPALVVAPGHSGTGAKSDGTAQAPKTAKAVPRAEYDAMSLTQRSAFLASGGIIQP